MQSTPASFETVRSVKQMPTLEITSEELRNMAVFVVLRFVKEDAANLVTPKKIQMIKELRDVLRGSITVTLNTDYWSPVTVVGLKEAKDAIDNALAALGI